MGGEAQVSGPFSVFPAYFPESAAAPGGLKKGQTKPGENKIPAPCWAVGFDAPPLTLRGTIPLITINHHGRRAGEARGELAAVWRGRAARPSLRPSFAAVRWGGAAEGRPLGPLEPLAAATCRARTTPPGRPRALRRSPAGAEAGWEGGGDGDAEETLRGRRLRAAPHRAAAPGRGPAGVCGTCPAERSLPAAGARPPAPPRWRIPPSAASK